MVEGEIDCLSVLESGYKNVVSVPFGANNYSYLEENWEWFEEFESVIIWSDGDDPGKQMKKEVSFRLGTWRCKYVEIPEEFSIKDGKKVTCKDANEVLFYYGKEKVLELINNAQELPITGVADLSTVSDFDIETALGLYTHLQPIDDTVYKFLFGSVVLVTGVKGAGKSTLLNQIFVCESLNQGYPVYLFSGELSSPILKSWIELSMAGRPFVDMKGQFIHTIKIETRKKMREWYKEKIWVYDQNSNKADDVLDKAINTVRKYGVKTVILDNLMVLDLGSNGTDIYEKQKEFLNKLIRIANTYNILIVLVAHPKKLMNGFELNADDISGSNSMGNLAQYILSVKRYSEKEKKGEKDKRGGYVKGKEPIDFDVAVDTLKNRFTGKVGRSNLYFDYTSYRFYSKVSELYKRFKWNGDQSALPTKDPNDHCSEPDFVKD